MFKPAKIKSKSYSTIEKIEQLEIKLISVRFESKSTNTKQHRIIIIDYAFQAQEILKTSNKLSQKKDFEYIYKYTVNFR